MTVNWDTEKISKNVKQAAARGVFIGTELVKTLAIQKITAGGKSGILYRRRDTTHQASAPGEAPANDTGRLVQSIETKVDTARLVGEVKFQTAYAAALEFGTNKMAPRPYARVSLAESQGKIEEAIVDQVAAVL